MDHPITVLMAEDDEEDRMFVQEAWDENRLNNDLRFVTDGEELMDYLERKGEYGDTKEAPRPGIILLDLNMPRKDGREALQEIKANPELRHIPVVVLTSSKAEEDILRSYDLGVSSYLVKPVTFDKLLNLIKEMGRYWLEIVELPERQT
mgnify:FL=1